MVVEAIRIEELSKVFRSKKGPKEQREIWALNNASFAVLRGEIFGLLGPNGAGKTTAIRCIAGLLKPASGMIFINGEKINPFQVHLLRRDMGFLTENHGSYEHLSLYENLKFFGSFYGIEKDLERRIYEVLEQIELLQRKDMKAGKLSKGQKQRLAIARAILHNPQIIFFDEPTSGLDPVASVKIRNLILGLKDKNRTIFINSHNLEEVQKICDRVAILDQGKVKRIGTPEDLRKDLWDAQEMTCILKDPISEEIKQKLSRLDYIKSYRIEENKIFIYSEDINESTPKIVRELVLLNANILEVSQTVQSLEDIYLKLMNEEKERAPQK